MKPIRKILILTIIVTGIVVFWLAPGINKSNAKMYTRVYENTDAKKLPGRSDTMKNNTAMRKKDKKVYKKESIKAEAKLKNIKPEMFSRATHFREDLIVEELELDEKAVEAKRDSINLAVYDSLARR